MIDVILKNYSHKNNIYFKNFKINNQKTEFDMRISISSKKYSNYFDEISRHHSIEVMKGFVRKFLLNIKRNAIILDIGCGWCWHWQGISKLRPDIKILALDFVTQNFIHAQKILSNEDLKQVYFINDNFENFLQEKGLFDGIWSAQTFQHIGNLENNFKKVSYILNENGLFFNFNLNYSILARLKNLIKNQNKEYFVNNYYYLDRNIENQKKILQENFKKIDIYYCEFLFHPEIKFFFGKKNSLIAKLDSFLSGNNLLSSFARQVLMVASK